MTRLELLFLPCLVFSLVAFSPLGAAEETETDTAPPSSEEGGAGDPGGGKKGESPKEPETREQRRAQKRLKNRKAIRAKRRLREEARRAEEQKRRDKQRALKEAYAKKRGQQIEEREEEQESSDLPAGAVDPDDLEDGYYVGEADGHDGKIKVVVKINNGRIRQIKVRESDESKPRGAFGRIASLILRKNRSAVDSVTGATETSKGFMAAVEAALASKKPLEQSPSRVKKSGERKKTAKNDKKESAEVPGDASGGNAAGEATDKSKDKDKADEGADSASETPAAP